MDMCVFLVLTLHVIISTIDHVNCEDEKSHKIKGEDYIAIIFFSLLVGLSIAILFTYLLRGKYAA